MIPVWIQAGLWGRLAGAALLAGAAVAHFFDMSQRMVAATMAFGSGILISILAFDLMNEAYRTGGFDATSIGFLGGAAAFTLADWILATQGAKHRKRSGDRQPSEEEHTGSGLAIAIGSLLDSIPESLIIGLGMIGGGAVNMSIVVVVFLSNIPEGLSSTAGMKEAHRSAGYIFGVWGGITLVCGVGAVIGYTALQHVSPNAISAINAIAAGALLAMVVDTMIPEAFEKTHEFTGLVSVSGFLCGFMLTKNF
ncbi:MAG: ZIP family zinc transporter [Burkholderiales bacterium RIFCSPLOWO2_02_FULL_57_36]|nr:MAG: ZIP family zinc transporter [Burkholderiales bacterium RIFCSPLOWO2_02_FULL_57_36]